MERYDLVVLGCGPAGEKGAVQAAYFGRKVLVVERAPQPGGAMVHTGTLASKTLRESALYIGGWRSRGLDGVELSLGRMPTIEELSFRRVRVAAAESERIRSNLERHGVDLVRAVGSFEGPNTIRLSTPEGDRLVTADKVLIATGTRPSRPALFDFSRKELCDSDEIVVMDKLPRSMAVVGAGVIGAEYASIFAALGIEVTLVDGRARVMPFLDREVGERLSRELERIGVRMRLGVDVRACEVRGDWDVALSLSDGSVLDVECVLVAAGRQGNVEALALDRAGVAVGRRGLVPVDAHYRTNVPHIYAAGDLIGHPSLASTSMEQARVAICHAFELGYKQAVGALLPYGIYTIPECSFVGATEEELQEKGRKYVVGRAELAENARGRIMGETGFIKLLVDAGDRRLLGAHAVGERSSELVHVAQAHMAHAAQVDVFIDQVFNYPTLGEAFKYAAYDALGRLGASPGRSL